MPQPTSFSFHLRKQTRDAPSDDANFGKLQWKLIQNTEWCLQKLFLLMFTWMIWKRKVSRKAFRSKSFLPKIFTIDEILDNFSCVSKLLTLNETNSKCILAIKTNFLCKLQLYLLRWRFKEQEYFHKYESV